MSIRDRLFTRDIAHAARERREQQRAELEHDRAEVAHDRADVAHDRGEVAHDRERLVVGPTTPPAFDGIPRPAPTPEADNRLATNVDRAPASAEAHAIFPGNEAGGFRTRWEAIQTGFVDEPRASVEQADALVAQVVTRLAEVFSEERAQLEHQWDRGDSISTEDLRIALKRYRAFFDRLLSV